MIQQIQKFIYNGLTLASLNEKTENTLEKIAVALKLSEERVILAYKNWEQAGIISISKTLPIKITYNSVKNPIPNTVKYSAKKYKVFVEELTRLFPEKVLSPNEIAEYIELLRINKMEINAMLLIIKYCTEIKLGTCSTPYILAVANDWINRGLITEEKVNENIQELENNSECIRMILKSIGIKRDANLEDRQFYLKWTRDYKYNLDAILTAAKAQKRKGGMQKLNNYIEELKSINAFSSEEIATHTKNKQKIFDLSVNVVKNMGGYYASMDIVIETYINPWIAKGFTEKALLLIAKILFYKKH